MSPAPVTSVRIDSLDTARAFALVLGVVFHASLSFCPVFLGWAVMDVSTSGVIPPFLTVAHGFRLELFFLLAGYFGRLAVARQGWRLFLTTRALRLGVPFILGWFLVSPLLVSGWVMGAASLRGEVDIRAGLIAGLTVFDGFPGTAFTRTHLWFLYYLLLLTAAAFVLAMLSRAHRVGLQAAFVRVDRGLGWLCRSPLAALVLAAPTAVVLRLMQHGAVDTPDRSLIPHLPVLALYGGFFALGWWFQRRPGVLRDFGRHSVARGAVVTLAVSGTCWLEPALRDAGNPHHEALRWSFAFCYGAMMWSLVQLILGLTSAWAKRPRRWVRYVSDSAYWMYLSHLPLVVWLQVAVAEVPVSWAAKLGGVTLVTVFLCLVSYDLLVRPSWVGHILSGKRLPSVLLSYLSRALPAAKLAPLP